MDSLPDFDELVEMWREVEGVYEELNIGHVPSLVEFAYEYGYRMSREVAKERWER